MLKSKYLHVRIRRVFSFAYVKITLEEIIYTFDVISSVYDKISINQPI